MKVEPGKLVCRFCAASLERVFVDLGTSPLANSYLDPEDLLRPELFYPLRVYVCEQCLLVQLPEYESPESIFGDYAYFSSYSDSWLEHARRYVERMVDRFGLDRNSQVIEIASNDGYLLQYFKQREIPVLGIEPAANVAAAALERGIPSRVQFFDTRTAGELVQEGVQADLLLGNNVLAHVPGLNGFVAGLKMVLAPGGVLTFEFPHLLRLMKSNQFDTIYHEHYSYFSFAVVRRVFANAGLTLFDVDEIPTHGGSLRIYGRHSEEIDAQPGLVEASVEKLMARESEAGLSRIDGYLSFGEQVYETKRSLLDFLIRARREGASIVGYGAPAKGNTLLNYCGVGRDFIEYTVDRSPEKQGRCLPGTRIPIYPPERIFETRPDYVLILPWNIKEEIVEQMSAVRGWGGRFVTAIPETTVL